MPEKPSPFVEKNAIISLNSAKENIMKGILSCI